VTRDPFQSGPFPLPPPPPPPTTILGHIHARIAKATGSAKFWVIVIGILFAYPLASAMVKRVPDPPKVMFQLPDFTLTDQLGQPFGSKELEGRVWIANFIFTNCPSRCPLLSADMSKLQKRMRNMGNAVYLVSFSVDPDRDTPERLKEYAEKYHANVRRWRFLTGELDKVKAAVVAGFKMPMDPGTATSSTGDTQTLFDITHGTRFVLVDQKGRVRGFYDATDDGMDELVRDLSLVVSLEGDT
jgi:protein SCO1